MINERLLDKGPFPPLVRVFVAVNVTAQIRSQAQEVIAALSHADAKVGWAKPDGMHLTLKFLGEIPRDDLDLIKQTICDVLSNTRDFAICVEGLGRFPEQGPPRVIWLGIKEGAEELAVMAKNIDSALVKLGFPGENRPWQPHITLGRVHSTFRTQDLIKIMQSTPITGMEPYNAGTVWLMRSQLGRGNPIYTNLAGWELKTDGA